MTDVEIVFEALKAAASVSGETLVKSAVADAYTHFKGKLMDVIRAHLPKEKGSDADQQLVVNAEKGDKTAIDDLRARVNGIPEDTLSDLANDARIFLTQCGQAGLTGPFVINKGEVKKQINIGKVNHVEIK